MNDSLTAVVDSSKDLQSAVRRFLSEIGAWTERVVRSYPEGITSDSHDGGTFMTPWAPYIRATGDQRPVAFMSQYRDQARRQFEESGQWLDGYWRRQEVHHGTEHFDIFLRTLWELRPEDAETKEQIEDAAEHIGNWKQEIPAWYDWDSGLFRSFYLGTEHVGEPSPNIPDHMRMVSLSLLAHKATGRKRYLTLAHHHGMQWASALTSSENLPVGITREGVICDLGDDESSYFSFVGAAPDDLSTDLPRAENLLASGVPDILLALWRKTGETLYLTASERIIDVATAELDSPIAWQVQAAIRRYREIADSRRYDEQIRAVPSSSLRPISELTIVPQVDTPRVRGALGMRSDKPDWRDQDDSPAPSPLLMALVAVVTEDDRLFTRAVDLALAYFRLAQRAFGDVTHHGCGSQSLAAVCRGHGRLNGAGVVSEVLIPALREVDE